MAATASTYTAAVIPSAGKPIEYQKFPIPQPQKGGVLIKVTYAGVCGTDRYLWQGKMTFPVPYVLGHEGVGRIEALGEGVVTDHAGQPVKPGDHVLWNPVAPCHACYECSVARDFTSCPNASFLSPAGQGPWASYTTIACLKPGNAFYRINPSTPVEAVAAVGCALTTMLQGIDNLGPKGIESGSTVLVQGAGPLGLTAIMLAKLAGARNIIVVELHEKRLSMAKRFGATEVISLAKYQTPEKRGDRIREFLSVAGDYRGIDLIIECSGRAESFAEGLKLMRRNSRYLLVGTWAGSGEVPIDPYHLVRSAHQIVGTTYAAPQHYYRAVKLVEQYHTIFPLAECVTHKLPLNHAEEAFDLIVQGDAVKVVIEPQSQGEA